MPPRFFVPACLAVLFPFCGADARPQETAPAAPAPAPALAAGLVTLELELLRAPAQKVAESVFAGRGDPAEDSALREKLLAGGATSVMRCSVTGASGQDLEDNKLKTTIEPYIWVYSSAWQRQGAAMKEGSEIPLMTEEDYETHGETRETGHLLQATLTLEEDGIVAHLNFRWMGPPVIREVNSWPVKGRTARQIQDRQWETLTRLMLPADKVVLLSTAPEPAEAEGRPTGFTFLAFVKASAGAGTRPAKKKKRSDEDEDEDDSESKLQTVQAWTLETPAALAQEWLFRRKDPAGDEEQFVKWLSAAAAGKSDGPALVAVETLRQHAHMNTDYFVDSRLQWQEPRGFEPPDTRWVKFVPVPNECERRAVAHRLECREDTATLTLPVGQLKRTRWYGSTRGAKDDPVGVEATLNASSEGGLFTGRQPGKIFLAAAHPRGTNMRLTFVRSFAPAVSGWSSDEHTLTVLETPPGPWLPRLTAGPDRVPQAEELTAAAAEGRASVLHQEVCVCCAHGFGRWKRESTHPWLRFDNYLNPSIHDGKFCFNPRFVFGSVPACFLEMEQSGAVGLTVSGEPVDRRLGVWMTKLPDYSAENSSISVPEWPQLILQAGVPLPPGRQVIAAVSLERSWKDPAQRALHWFVLRRLPLTGKNPLDNAPLPPLPVTSFTIHDKDGTVLEHVTLAGSGAFSDGRLLHTVVPEKLYGHAFDENVPADIGRPGINMGSPEFEETLDGTAVTIGKDGWTLSHSPEHAKKITESVTGYTEQPAGKDYGPSEPVPISFERLVLRREELKGALPAPGTPLIQPLEGGRRLTVNVR